MSDKPEYQPIFHIGNKHSEDCGKPPHLDRNIRKRYHGYFENEYGEQAIFVYDYEVNEGILWMGGCGMGNLVQGYRGSCAGISFREKRSAVALQLLDCSHRRDAKMKRSEVARSASAFFSRGMDDLMDSLRC